MGGVLSLNFHNTFFNLFILNWQFYFPYIPLFFYIGLRDYVTFDLMWRRRILQVSPYKQIMICGDAVTFQLLVNDTINMWVCVHAFPLDLVSKDYDLWPLLVWASGPHQLPRCLGFTAPCWLNGRTSVSRAAALWPRRKIKTRQNYKNTIKEHNLEETKTPLHHAFYLGFANVIKSKPALDIGHNLVNCSFDSDYLGSLQRYYSHVKVLKKQYNTITLQFLLTAWLVYGDDTSLLDCIKLGCLGGRRYILYNSFTLQRWTHYSPITDGCFNNVCLYW